jgi:hypothetical protein
VRKSYTIQLDSLDFGQLLDGLELRGMVGRLALRGVVVSQRDTTHQRTEKYLRSGYIEGDWRAHVEAEAEVKTERDALMGSTRARLF